MPSKELPNAHQNRNGSIESGGLAYQLVLCDEAQSRPHGQRGGSPFHQQTKTKAAQVIAT